MNKCFEAFIDNLSKKSGYDYDFLVDMFMDAMEEDGYVDLEYFIDVTMEHDW